MKKIWTFIFLIIAALFIYEIKSTYSYYIDEYNNSVDFKVANWTVIVNDEDITLEENNEFVIKDYNYIAIPDSEVSAPNNKFAPGTIAEFKIEVDPSKVDVAFLYLFNIDMSFIDNENIKIKYVKNTLNNITYNEEDDIYKGTYLLEDVMKNKKDIITVGIEWIDNVNNNDFEFVSNYEDTLEIPVSMTFKQKME